MKPIFKNKGSPTDISCYRPISILLALSEIFEKIVHRNIYKHITEHKLLSDKQSGYRPNHSTQHQLLYLTHSLYKSLDNGHNFTAIYLDISKYFGKIWHKGLLHKCKTEFGITGRLLDWMESYLKDRQQRVKIGDIFSTTETIYADCPQGSVLVDFLLSSTRTDSLIGHTTTSRSLPTTPPSTPPTNRLTYRKFSFHFKKT